jgi:hypothetical protein
LSAAGFAEYHPVATNRTADGRGINRRVDIVILGRGIQDLAMAPAGIGSQTQSAISQAASMPTRPQTNSAQSTPITPQ